MWTVLGDKYVTIGMVESPGVAGFKFVVDF